MDRVILQRSFSTGIVGRTSKPWDPFQWLGLLVSMYVPVPTIRVKHYDR
ncbi:MAG: hypothetical protein J7M25_16370 [Deltaproteobacteria bacterium]|nr:hypothetical protein [Deltaproteobacteria bacterium]